MIRLAEEDSFDVMVTADQGLHYQQNARGRKLARVLSTSRERVVLANPEPILAAINAATAGGFTTVDIGQ